MQLPKGFKLQIKICEAQIKIENVAKEEERYSWFIGWNQKLLTFL